MMLKTLLIIIFLILLKVISFAGPPDVEEFSYMSGRFKITLHGCFSKPCIYQPATYQNLFFFDSDYVSRTFLFMGRTGEKTFTIRSHSDKEINLIFVYFIPNDLLFLSNIGDHPPCGPQDHIWLKMIELRGNSLECQIILPTCLK